MSILKNPLISLGAHGSLSDAITFTRRRGIDIAEKKPVLPYFLTLPVQYQRWLYEDYVAFWNQQTNAVKQVYRTAGVRHHLTGFQYWLKYHLTHLPDILAYYRLDAHSAPTTPDSSRNTNTGTVIGAIPATGLIAGCLYFDGVNDFVRCPATLNFGTGPFSISVFANYYSHDSAVFAKGSWGGVGDIILYDWNVIRPLGSVVIFSQGAGLGMGMFAPVPLDEWHHYLITRIGVLFSFYYDGALIDTQNIVPNYDFTNPHFFTIGAREDGTEKLHEGLVDNCILYNRALTQADALRHSLRRWTL